jgi:hypothetical protein
MFNIVTHMASVVKVALFSWPPAFPFSSASVPGLSSRVVEGNPREHHFQRERTAVRTLPRKVHRAEATATEFSFDDVFHDPLLGEGVRLLFV